MPVAFQCTCTRDSTLGMRTSTVTHSLQQLGILLTTHVSCCRPGYACPAAQGEPGHSSLGAHAPGTLSPRASSRKLTAPSMPVMQETDEAGDGDEGEEEEEEEEELVGDGSEATGAERDGAAGAGDDEDGVLSTFFPCCSRDGLCLNTCSSSLCTTCRS